MKLNDYLQAQAKKRQQADIIMSHDGEPDDIKALAALVGALTQYKQPIKLTFLVGEGNSGIKILRMQKLIEILQEQGVLKDNITINVIQGYGSNKNFELDGVELFGSKENVDTALAASKLGNGVSLEEHQAALEKLADIFRKNPETFVIATKPPREFIDLCMAEETAELMRSATYWGTFSFNIRTLMSEAEDAQVQGEDKKAAVLATQASIFKFLSSFKQLYYFESFFALGSVNSFNETDSASLFAHLDETAFGHAFSQLMKNWNAHILGTDPEKIAKYAKDDVMREIVLSTLSTNWTAESERVIRDALTFDTIADEKDRKKEEGGIDRKIKKWQNITSKGAQFIAADPVGVLACLGETSHINLQALPFHVNFSESCYTVLSTSEAGGAAKAGASVYVIVPSSDKYVLTSRHFVDHQRLIAEKKDLEDAIKRGSPFLQQSN